MPEPEERGSETEKLAGTINESIEFLDRIASVVLSIIRGCLWVVLAYLAVLVVAFSFGFVYDSIAARVGPSLALVALVAAGWLVVRWRSRRKQGGGPPT